MEPLVLTLPVPPSVNALYRNVPGRGRVKTKAYKAWIESAGWELLLQSRQHIGRPAPLFSGRVTLDIEVQRQRGDCTNRVKASEDLLVKHGVILDDRYVEKCSIAWSDEVRGMRITVRAVVGTEIAA